MINTYKVLLYLWFAKYSFKKSSYPKNKFIIISRSRTGSTMLINYLKEISGSLVLGELMGRKKYVPYWNQIPELVYKFKKKGCSLAGFKYFYYHPIDDRDANKFIFEYLFAHPEIKIIHWKREDLLAVILSRYIALESGSWGKKKRGRTLKPFTIDKNGFQYELEKTLADINIIENIFEDRKNYLELTYEDITKRGKLQDLFDFLEVNGKHIQHNFKSSQKSESRYKFIENLQEIKDIYIKRMNEFKS